MASAKELHSESDAQVYPQYPHVTIYHTSEAYDLLKNIEVGTVLDLFVRAVVSSKAESVENKEGNCIGLELRSIDVAMSYDKDFGEPY